MRERRKMSSSESLLTADQRPASPAAPKIGPNSEVLGQSLLNAADTKSTPSWLARLKADVVSDWRSTNWKKFGKGYLLGFWIYCLFTTAAVLPVYLYLIGVSSFEFQGLVEVDLGSPGCLPNDAFDARSPSYNIFDPSGFFQITHGFGNLSFTQAKVIDLIWDIVVGRGGQAVLAYFLWRSFSTYFKLSMNTQPLTYSTFWAIFIDRQPSLVGVYRVTRDFIYQQARRSKSIMIFVPFSMLFVLAFPIMMSAMTGYRPNLAAFVADNANSLIPFEKFTLAAYVIHDGDRIGFTEDYVVPFMFGLRFYGIRRAALYARSHGNSEPLGLTGDAYFAEAASKVCIVNNHPETACQLSYNVSNYVAKYGFYALDNTTGKPTDIDTIWMGERLEKPALNISAFYLPPGGTTKYFGHEWVDPRTKTKPFANASNLALNIEGTKEFYSLDHVQKNGNCQQQKSYQWGFSFLQVFIMAILLLIWTCGTYLIWLKAHKITERQAQLDGADKEVPSELKAAVTLASNLRFEMAMVHKERPETLTNQQLHTAIREDLHGGRILPAGAESNTTTTAAPQQHYNILGEIWDLCKKRWFIFPVLVILTCYMTTMVLLPVLAGAAAGAMLVLPIHTGFVFALVVGRTSRSRCFFAWAGIFAMIFCLVVAGMVFLRPPV